jgi:hypothetical protein
MRAFTFLIFVLPVFCLAQPASIVIDSVGNNARIKYAGLSTNILIGSNAGNFSGLGGANNFIGLNAGSSHTSGIRNIAIGNDAGRNLMTNNYNINLGVGAGFSNESGAGNINIGDEAGYSDVLGSENVRIGDYVGRNSIGSRNVLIGTSVGLDLVGDDQLMIDNNSTPFPLLHGFFDKDSLVINGDLRVTGNLIAPIDVSQITGILGSGNSAVFPVVIDNTVSIEIEGIINSTALITNSVGFEADTMTLPGSCLEPTIGFTAEFPITFETANTTDISALNIWFSGPSPRSGSIIIRDIGGNETYRFNFFDYVPNSTTAGSDGRTSFTISHNQVPNNNVAFEIDEYLGSSFSYNPATDKRVEIEGITHAFFCPAVEVDYTKRVITLEMTYNEGLGLVNWINNMVRGINTTKRAMSIIETTDGMTETSRENFFEVIPFKYEIIYGFGLNTKMKARIQLLYGCNEPG